MKKHLAVGIFSVFSLAAIHNANAQNLNAQSDSGFTAQSSGIKTAPKVATLDLMNVQSDYRPMMITTGIYHDEEGVRVEKPADYKGPENYIEDHSDNGKFKQSAETPTIFRSFNGYNDYQYTPPDNSIAISNDGYVISAMNCNYRIFKPDGTLVKYSSFYDLFKTQYPGLSGPLFDPRVIYDPVADRFIIVTLYQHLADSSKIMVMFSKTSNPADGWNLYALKGDVLNKSEWTDYPNIGISDRELFITGNLFDNSQNYREPMVLQINKDDGYTGNALNYQTWSGIKDASAGYAFTLVPVSNGVSGTYGSAMYFVSNLMSGGNKVNLYQLTGPMGTPNLQMTRTSVTIPFSYYSNYTSTQKGSTDYLNAGDCRIKQAFMMDGVIHYVFAMANENNYGAVAYCRLNTITKGVEYRVLGENLFNYSYPSIASMSTDDKGQSAMICFERAGSGIYPDVDIAYCDDNMNISNSVVIQNGASAVNITSDHSERWGDYSTIARRFNTKDCIMAGCYGVSGKWNTRIAEVGLASNGTAVQTPTEDNAEVNVFPNPVVDYFSVSFNLKKDAGVNVSLYDMQGRMVQTLYNGHTNAGKQIFSFNQAALAPGIYMLEVTADGQPLLSKKLIQK